MNLVGPSMACLAVPQLGSSVNQLGEEANSRQQAQEQLAQVFLAKGNYTGWLLYAQAMMEYMWDHGVSPAYQEHYCVQHRTDAQSPLNPAYNGHPQLFSPIIQQKPTWAAQYSSSCRTASCSGLAATAWSMGVLQKMCLTALSSSKSTSTCRL